MHMRRCLLPTLGCASVQCGTFLVPGAILTRCYSGCQQWLLWVPAGLESRFTGWKSASALLINAAIVSFDNWWLLCCCSAQLEQFAIQCHCVRDNRHLQAPAFCSHTYLTELRCISFYFVLQCSLFFFTQRHYKNICLIIK